MAVGGEAVGVRLWEVRLWVSDIWSPSPMPPQHPGCGHLARSVTEEPGRAQGDVLAPWLTCN